LPRAKRKAAQRSSRARLTPSKVGIRSDPSSAHCAGRYYKRVSNTQSSREREWSIGDGSVRQRAGCHVGS
jgi:hypothetical protein